MSQENNRTGKGERDKREERKMRQEQMLQALFVLNTTALYGIIAYAVVRYCAGTVFSLFEGTMLVSGSLFTTAVSAYLFFRQ